MSNVSALQKVRHDYQPKLPPVLARHGLTLNVAEGAKTVPAADAAVIAGIFPLTVGLPVVTFAPGQPRNATRPLKVGVVLSGGQAPGGHNVLAGLHDAIKAYHPDSILYGFLGGASGLMNNRFKILDAAYIDAFRNTGGFDMIGSGRSKIEKPEDFANSVKSCKANDITALVVVGGDDSNTNAAVLAEYCLREKAGIQVIGCPKTIDGDLKNEQIEISFGFDTATKLYSELIGNIARDANSAKKYWHFVKLMGRSASHVTLECALQCHPNVALISEEIAIKRMTLSQIVDTIAQTVAARAAQGNNFGVVLIPEGLFEFLADARTLIAELNEILAKNEAAVKAMASAAERDAFVTGKLGKESAGIFSDFPAALREQLINERDDAGNVPVSQIETEKELVARVARLLAQWKKEEKFKGKFTAQTHFFGYEGRCAAPTNFDADYCYSLGYTAAALIASGRTGYLASVRNVARPASEWVAGGTPLTMMMNIERRKGKDKPVIRKALVELDSKPFKTFAANRDRWAVETDYVYPGPIQYFGPAEVCDRTTVTLQLEQSR